MFVRPFAIRLRIECCLGVRPIAVPGRDALWESKDPVEIVSRCKRSRKGRSPSRRASSDASDVSLRLHVVGHKPLASALNDDVKKPSPTAVVTKETVGPSRCAATAGFFLWFAVCGEHNGERSYKDMVAAEERLVTIKRLN